MDMRENLDSDLLKEAMDETREECNDNTDRLRSEFLGRLYGRFVTTDSAGSPVVRWRELFEDFLKVFPYKKG